MLGAPPATAVPIGPFNATRLRRTDSTAPSVTNCPVADAFSERASTSSQSIWTPAASRMRRTAAATSGPIPSPAINVTLCLKKFPSHSCSFLVTIIQGFTGEPGEFLPALLWDRLLSSRRRLHVHPEHFGPVDSVSPRHLHPHI